MTETASRSPLFRWQAFAVHLGLTLVVLGALALLTLHWFPGYLFELDGGLQALQVTVGVGLVLGPLLTLLVASPTKARHLLRLDFSLIALAQALALGWGTWMAWDNRPCAVIWVDGTLYSRPCSAFADEPAAREKIAQLTADRPAWIAIDLPTDPFARDRYIKEAMARNSSVEFEPGLYTAFSPASPAVRAASRKLAEKGLIPGDREQLLAGGTTMEALLAGERLLLPAKSRYGRYFLVMDAQSGDIQHRFPASGADR